MSAVAAGKDAEIPAIGRRDELGQMLAAVTTFKASLECRQNELRMQNVRFDAALENMAQGLCMLDKHERVIVCNRVYKDLYRLPDELCRPGTPLTDIFKHNIELGFYGADVTLASMLTEERARSARAETTVSHLELRDGRTLLSLTRPWLTGAWLTRKSLVMTAGSPALFSGFARRVAGVAGCFSFSFPCGIAHLFFSSGALFLSYLFLGCCGGLRGFGGCLSLALCRNPDLLRKAPRFALRLTNVARFAHSQPRRLPLDKCGIVGSRPLKELRRRGLLGIAGCAQPLTEPFLFVSAH